MTLRSVSLTRVLWAVAVVLAVVVVGTAYLGRRGDGEASVIVVVAKQPIPAGTFVKPRMYDLLTVPQDQVQPGTLTDLRYLALRHVARPIHRGKRFDTSDFSR